MLVAFDRQGTVFFSQFIKFHTKFQFVVNIICRYIIKMVTKCTTRLLNSLLTSKWPDDPAKFTFAGPAKIYQIARPDSISDPVGY